MAVVDEAWDSSTWMAEEFHVAMNSEDGAKVKKTYYWNPSNLPVTAAGMMPYLHSEIPVSLREAVEVLSE